MPSSYSTNLRFELQATGENATTWGNKANSIFNLIEDSISEISSIAMGDANVTLTTNNGAADQARNAMLEFTGSLSATRSVTIPLKPKIYIVRNATTGGHEITFTNGTNSVTLANGGWYQVWTDGTSVYKSANMAVEVATAAGLSDLSGVTDVETAKDNLGISAGKPSAVLSKSWAYNSSEELTESEWTEHPLDTEDYDPDGLVLINSNQFTVSEDGWIEWHATFTVVSSGAGSGQANVKTRLWNVTSDTLVVDGTLAAHASGDSNTDTLFSFGGGPVVADNTYAIEYFEEGTNFSTVYFVKPTGTRPNFETTRNIRVKFWSD